MIKVCNSVHHHTIQINQPTRCNKFSVYYLKFIYSSKCFGRPHAHHQELSCSSSLWFYLCSMVITVLLVVVRPAGPTTTNSTAITTFLGKPEAAAAVVELLMMGVRTPETY